MPRTAFTANGAPVSQSLRLSALRPALRASPILLAGSDEVQRAAVLDELAYTLPEGACFEQAAAFWEVLALAPECRMVIFSGDLEDGSAETFMQTLRQRHPELPTVSLKAHPHSSA